MKQRIVTVESLREEEGYKYVRFEEYEEEFLVSARPVRPARGPGVRPGQRRVMGHGLFLMGMPLTSKKVEGYVVVRPVEDLAFKGALDPLAILLDPNYIDIDVDDLAISREHGVTRLEFYYDHGLYKDYSLEIPDFDPRTFGDCLIRLFCKDLRHDEQLPVDDIYGVVIRCYNRDAECIFYRPPEGT